MLHCGIGEYKTQQDIRHCRLSASHSGGTNSNAGWSHHLRRQGLNAAIRNQPTDMPIDQISAINRLREVLLGKQDEKEQQHDRAQPQREWCTAGESHKRLITKCTTPPIHVIPANDDEVENGFLMSQPKTEAPNRYNLRSRATLIANSIVITEMKNDKQRNLWEPVSAPQLHFRGCQCKLNNGWSHR